MKRVTTLCVTVLLALGLLAGCAPAPAETSSIAPSAPETSVAQSQSESGAARTTFRIAGLKGPTTMGMVRLMEQADAGEGRHDYEVEVFGAADEVNAKLISGELDVAMVPANVASVLYNNTDGAVQVAAINTLGVLYVVEMGESVSSLEDLRGKTVYSTGKGQTPEYVLNYLLRENGIDPDTDLTIEYLSESTEVAAKLAATGEGIAVLPQPYVTALQAQNEDVRVALSLTEEWDKLDTDSALVTGVLVARKEFIEQNPEAFTEFLEDYKDSIEWVQANTAEAAQLVAQYGIVEKAAIAEKALPQCNIVYIDGGEMKTMLSGYLQVLYDQEAKSVGGSVPDDGFYYGADQQ